VAIAAIAVGTALVVAGFVSYVDKVEDFDRTLVPGNLQVEITDPGGYSIYHEYDFDDFFVTEPTVEVIGPSGDPVALERYDATVTYTAGDHEGEGLFTFDADEVGTYEVTASDDGFSDRAGDSGIAVGPGLGSGLVAAILGGTLVGLAGLVAAVVIVVVVAVRRGRSKRAQLAAAAAATGPSSSPWWNAPPPPM
jgi:hypothetical protein